MSSITVEQLQVLITANNEDVKAKLSQITNQLNNTEQQTTKLSKASAVAFGAIAGAASALANKGINMITDSVSGAIRRVDTLANSERVFKNLGFSAGDTKAAMNDLQASIKGLPTSLDDAVRGVQTLAATQGDIKLAQKTFTALNNGILAMGGSADMVNGAILQLSQLPMDGPLDAQTWNSLRQNGLTPVFTAMAKESGKSVGELKDAFGKGELTVKDFTDMLIKMDKDGGGGMASLEKQVKDSTKGISTSADNMKTAVVRGMGEILKAVGNDNISKALNAIGDGFESGLKSVIPLIAGIKELGAQAAKFLKPALDTLWYSINGQLIPALKQALESIRPVATMVGQTLVAALYAAIAVITVAISIMSGLIDIVTRNETVFTALVGAVVGATAAVVAARIVVVAYTAASAAMAAATTVLTLAMSLHSQGLGIVRAAWLALNITMAASPIGIVTVAIGALIGAVAALSFATSGQTEEERKLNDQRDRSIRLAKDLKDSEDELKNAKDGVKDASLRQERAQRTYNDMVALYGEESLEAREAARQLEKANDNLKTANEKAQIAVDNNKVAIQQQKDEMDQLSQRLQNFNGKTFTYYIQGVEHAIQRGSDGKTYATPTFSTGGYTGQGGKHEIAGIVHKGEYVLPKEMVNQRTGLPKSFGQNIDAPSHSEQSTNLTINIGGEKLTDVVIRGINNQSFLNGASVLNI